MNVNNRCRYWLNLDVTIIDTRLGWLQRQFYLSGDAVRALVLKEPRIIAFGVGPLTVRHCQVFVGSIQNSTLLAYAPLPQ